MSFVNKLTKFPFIILVHVVTLLYCWVISVFTTAPLVVVALFAMGVTHKVPTIIFDRFPLVYLIATIPLTLVYFTLVEADKIKK